MSERTLHLHAQGAWHDHAYIVGTPDALRDLAAAIIRAVDDGEAMSPAYTADGEGFGCLVIRVADDECDKLLLPYTDEVVGKLSGVGPWELRPVERLRELDREAWEQCK